MWLQENRLPYELELEKQFADLKVFDENDPNGFGVRDAKKLNELWDLFEHVILTEKAPKLSDYNADKKSILQKRLQNVKSKVLTSIPSSQDLKEWFKESKNKHFCKKAISFEKEHMSRDRGPITQEELRRKAISFENDPEAAEWFAQEKQRVEPKEDIEELAKEIDIEPEELKEWLKSAGGKRFCKRAIKR